MNDLILTAEQAEMLSRVRGPIEVRDESGRVFGVLAPRLESGSDESAVPFHSAYDLAKHLGLLGSVADASADLSTNPRHLEGFGRE